MTSQTDAHPSTDAQAPPRYLPPVRTHSKVTGTLRLLLAIWLLVSSVRTFADPQQATLEQNIPMGILLPLAGLSFSLGVFLLSGFMSRVCGLALVGLGGWLVANVGAAVMPIVLILGGVYRALRGGGAWAMDIYVQKMQDKVRLRELNSPEPSSPRSPG
jgi:uncharacterized membrane protein YphA (DoxX/SURF4 family)